MASAELLSLSSSLSLPGALHAHLLMFSQLHQNKDEQLRETMAPGNLIKPQRQPDQQPSWKWLLSTELSPALLPTAPKVLICIPEKFHGNSTANRDAEAEGFDAMWRCLGSENLDSIPYLSLPATAYLPGNSGLVGKLHHPLSVRFLAFIDVPG